MLAYMLSKMRQHRDMQLKCFRFIISCSIPSSSFICNLHSNRSLNNSMMMYVMCPELYTCRSDIPIMLAILFDSNANISYLLAVYQPLGTGDESFTTLVLEGGAC